MSQWQLLRDAPADGATNMARDTALLDAVAAGAAPPTLRLYSWQPACVSIGRFQRESDIDTSACAAAGIELVRRPSGGRALLHCNDLTYAVAARTDDPLFGGATTILATYERISMALVAGLRLLGVAAELTPATRRAARSAACFAAPASYELTVHGRKLVGSAQARRNGALLQHGSIPLTRDATHLASLLTIPTPALADQMTCLEEVLDRPVTFDEAADALVAGMGECLVLNA